MAMSREVLQQLMAQQQGQRKKWSEALQEIKERIMKEQPKDRLELAVALMHIVGAMGFSVKGWHQWLSSLEAINNLTKNEIEEVYKELKPLVLKILEIDLRITEQKEREHEAEVKKRKKKSKKKPKKKGQYIS